MADPTKPKRKNEYGVELPEIGDATTPQGDPVALANQAADQARYDISDPGKAFRNAWRDAGFAWNPWNADLVKTGNRYATAAVPQYLEHVSRAGMGGASNSGLALRDFLVQYINGLMGGGGGLNTAGSVMPWNMEQATAGLGRLGGIAQSAQDQLAANAGDYSKVNLGNPLMNALAQMFSNPDVVSGMYSNAFAGSLGPMLQSTLGQHVGQAQQYYEDVTRPGQIRTAANKNQPTWAAILANQLGLPGR